MEKITKIEAREILKERLDDNEYGCVSINGITIYYDDYKLGDVDDEDFFITFYSETKYICAYRSYECELLMIGFDKYEII